MFCQALRITLSSSSSLDLVVSPCVSRHGHIVEGKGDLFKKQNKTVKRSTQRHSVPDADWSHLGGGRHHGRQRSESKLSVTAHRSGRVTTHREDPGGGEHTQACDLAPSIHSSSRVHFCSQPEITHTPCPREPPLPLHPPAFCCAVSTRTMRRGAAGLSCGWRVATRTHTVPLTRPHLPSDANAPVFRGVVEVEGRGGGGGLAGDRQNTRGKIRGGQKGCGVSVEIQDVREGKDRHHVQL